MSTGQVISYGTANTYLKIVLMGDVKVGKSSLIHRYVHHQFDPELKPTVSCVMFAYNPLKLFTILVAYFTFYLHENLILNLNLQI